MTKLKENIPNVLGALFLSIIFSAIGNLVGYDTGIAQSLPGLLILGAISLVGYSLSYIVPIEKMSSVLWISFIAIFISLPISPVSEQVIYHVNNVSLMSVVTPILGYAGVLIGKDWNAFKELGIRAVIISILVMAGTFLISSLLGDFFMVIFN